MRLRVAMIKTHYYIRSVAARQSRTSGCCKEEEEEEEEEEEKEKKEEEEEKEEEEGDFFKTHFLLAFTHVLPVHYPQSLLPRNDRT